MTRSARAGTRTTTRTRRNTCARTGSIPVLVAPRPSRAGRSDRGVRARQYRAQACRGRVLALNADLEERVQARTAASKRQIASWRPSATPCRTICAPPSLDRRLQSDPSPRARRGARYGSSAGAGCCRAQRAANGAPHRRPARAIPSGAQGSGAQACRHGRLARSVADGCSAASPDGRLNSTSDRCSAHRRPRSLGPGLDEPDRQRGQVHASMEPSRIEVRCRRRDVNALHGPDNGVGSTRVRRQALPAFQRLHQTSEFEAPALGSPSSRDRAPPRRPGLGRECARRRRHVRFSLPRRS